MKKKASVIIPAYNEEKSVAQVINLLKNNSYGIVDDVIVVDNGSEDNTGKEAEKSGAKVIVCNKRGKGYAMEKGLKFAKNEVIIFLDADINNYTENLVYLLSYPILNGQADFVKSKFERTGGRITELVAKPMLDILFPDLYKFSQPLSGMIAGKKSLFKKIKFEKDYGVDIGILLDMVKIGARVEEVYIGKINNDSQSWDELGKMSREVMTSILKRANLIEDAAKIS